MRLVMRSDNCFVDVLRRTRRLCLLAWIPSYVGIAPLCVITSGYLFTRYLAQTPIPLHPHPIDLRAFQHQNQDLSISSHNRHLQTIHHCHLEPSQRRCLIRILFRVAIISGMKSARSHGMKASFLLRHYSRKGNAKERCFSDMAIQVKPGWTLAPTFP